MLGDHNDTLMLSRDDPESNVHAPHFSIELNSIDPIGCHGHHDMMGLSGDGDDTMTLSRDDPELNVIASRFSTGLNKEQTSV